MAEVGLVKFAGAEIRLQEHNELHTALGLNQTPDYTTIYRFMRRLDQNLIQKALQEAALQIMNNQPTKNAILAVDATGLALGAIITFFINHKRDRG